MCFSKIIFKFFFKNLYHIPRSGSKLGQNSRSGSKFNEVGIWSHNTARLSLTWNITVRNVVEVKRDHWDPGAVTLTPDHHSLLKKAEINRLSTSSKNTSLVINLSVPELPLFWAAPAQEVRGPSRSRLRVRPNWVGSGSRQKRRLNAAPAPYTKISRFVPSKS